MNEAEALNQRLESEGWEFLTNALIWTGQEEEILGEDGKNFQHPKSYSIRYKEKGFKDVRLEKAYDIDGNLISSQDMKAVYVKR